jgi:hypothetical protein
MTIVSVDLAARRYADVGIAVLSDRGSEIEVELVTPSSLSLKGVPDASALAMTLCTLAKERNTRLLFLDGPQGWSGGTDPSVIMRDCERAAQTPGRTGLPGCVKPGSWTRMAVFSIAVFDALHDRGWPRLEDRNWGGDQRSIESFPTHAWRTLELAAIRPLPAKEKVRDAVKPWVDALRNRCAVRWPPRLQSHDELQAVVAGLAGILMERYGMGSCAVPGLSPYLQDGTWREGFIVSPTSAVCQQGVIRPTEGYSPTSRHKLR